jgi:hypothetical protein
MLTNLYLRNGTVYVPTVAKTEAGFYLDIDPVEVVSATDIESLQRVIGTVLTKGNPTVLTPTRGAFPKAVVLKYAKVKSWSAFEKGTVLLTIVENSGTYEIRPGRKRSDRGWEDDPTRIEFLPSGMKVNEVVQRVVALIQLSRGADLV